MTAVWLNGTLEKVGDARISAFDAGFQHAVGLFETMTARGSRVVHLHQHLDRLEVSLRETHVCVCARMIATYGISCGCRA